MKIILASVLYLLFITPLRAQSAEWAWTNSFGGHKDDIPADIITDPDGNIYMAGNFSDTAVFGNFVIPESAPYIANNGFICKVSPDGKVIWIKHQEGGANFTTSFNSLAYFNHSLYLSGSFSDSLNIDGRVLYTNGHKENTFFAKFSSEGDLAWVRSIADSNSENPLFPGKISIDSSGHLVLTGTFTGKVSIQGETIKTFKTQVYDFFLSRFDSSGALQWIVQADQYSSKIGATIGGRSLTVDRWNNIYVLGAFTDTIGFGEFSLYAAKDASSGDIFIAKFDSLGIFHGAFNSKGRYGATAYNICSDGDGIFTIGGGFYDVIDFGNNVKINASQSSRGEVFLAQFDPDFKARWAYNSTSTESQNTLEIDISDIRSDNLGSLYLAIPYSGREMFLQDTLISNYLSLATVKVSKNGLLQWAKSSHEINDDNSPGAPGHFSVTADRHHSVFCAGSMNHHYQFEGKFVSPALTPLKAWDEMHSGVTTSDIFLAKIGDSQSDVQSEANSATSSQIYPNPASHIVSIAVPDNAIPEQIKISTLLGTIKDIPVKVLSSSLVELNVSSLSGGAYVVSIPQADRIVVKTLVIVK